MKLALVGNPNSGKTTMFNALTGSSQYVGNWPGVTVEKKEGKLKNHKDVRIVDLPGIYSLSPYTLEEVITRDFLIVEKPDAIINIIDASNIERNLYLTTQLIETGIPVVIALNMMDVVRKNGDKIDLAKLPKSLGCEVSETSAVKGEGIHETVEKAIALANAKASIAVLHRFDDAVESAIRQIEETVSGNLPDGNPHWFAVKIFERDNKVLEKIALDADKKKIIEKIISQCEEKYADDTESIITNQRYSFIENVVHTCVKKKTGGLSTSDKIDIIITNRILALPIFALVMFLVYYLSISTVGSFATDWVNDNLFGDFIPNVIRGWLESVHAAEWLSPLILNGIVAGIGSVLGFLPQMLVLFLLLAILEDCGYMARIAFIMDRIFRRFGLSGKSFIPMLISTGCGVPGVMASRTIENISDRRLTIMTTTFMPCGAKLPIIALIAGALFGNAGWVATSAYFIGIASIIISGIILKKTKLFAGETSPFVMELPPYHMPRAKGVLIHMWDRGKAFVQKAGTIIFLACCAVWFLSSFNWSMRMVDTSESILASIGNVIAPVFAPLGWGNWKAAVATITGLIAKENVVGTFGILYGFSEVAEDGAEVWATLQASFTQLSAFSFLLFNLLCAPCFAAIGAIKQEMGNAKWTWIAIGYQTLYAYLTAFCVYQAGLFVTGGGFNFLTAITALIIAAALYLLFKPNKNSKLLELPRKEVNYG